VGSVRGSTTLPRKAVADRMTGFSRFALPLLATLTACAAEANVYRCTGDAHHGNGVSFIQEVGQSAPEEMFLEANTV
jgi:hypothetical protein